MYVCVCVCVQMLGQRVEWEQKMSIPALGSQPDYPPPAPAPASDVAPANTTIQYKGRGGGGSKKRDRSQLTDATNAAQHVSGVGCLRLVLVILLVCVRLMPRHRHRKYGVL